ncbi:MAG TPA: FecR family protein [Spirochaetota bacterium]|nr:FecR family protein [Spirochaetota bacterium]
MKRCMVIVLVVLAGGLFCSQVLDQPEEFASVTFFVGDVKKNAVDVQIGEVLNEKDVILTGQNASCDIKIGESIIRVKENSKLLVSQILRQNDTENVTLGLDVGKILCRPKKLMKNENFLVRTPTAVAGVRGTLFTVEADKKKTTRIKVFNGKVGVVKRVDALEQRVGIDKIIEESSPVVQNEKVVITAEEVKAAEKNVAKALSASAKEGAATDDAQVLLKVRKDISVAKKDVQKFKVEEFREEEEELIAVKQRAPEVMVAIRKAVRREGKAPMPDGSLLVTRHDIYFIKNGKVEGEWKVVNSPVRRDEDIYIASRDYVFCASIEGPVKWRKKMSSDGRIEIKDNELYVHARDGVKKLDLRTGETLE